jgi:hypothetical protein
MTYFIILLVIAAVMAARTIDLLLHDGRGPAAPPSSHFQDPRFAAPGSGRGRHHLRPPTTTKARSPRGDRAFVLVGG